jgi:hypothetical protein
MVAVAGVLFLLFREVYLPEGMAVLAAALALIATLRHQEGLQQVGKVIMAVV